MPTDGETTVRLFCWNDGCEVKDIRVVTFAGAKTLCPECGAELHDKPYRRPQRQYRTF